MLIPTIRNVLSVIVLGVFLLACQSLIGATPENDGNAVEDKQPVDVLHLKSGGELRGKIEKEIKDEENGRLYVLFRTESGGLLKLDKSRLIKRPRPADDLDAEYQRRLKIAGDDPDLLWKVYEWCEDQDSASIRFKHELNFLLRRISELDVNDERARKKLGFDFVDGRWVHKEQLYANHGYFRRGTTWAPEGIRDIEARDEMMNQEEGLRKRELNMWLKLVRKSGVTRNEVAQALFAFCDELAVPIIMDKAARDEKDPALRLIFVEAFGRVPSFEANQALCHFAIVDSEPDVRERAVTLLQQDHYNPATSTRLISPALRAKNNEYVRRAAFALGEIGSPTAILPLIDALETSHKIQLRGNEPGRMSMSFGPGGTGMQTGGGPQSKTVVAQNEESLSALNQITELDMGYDEQAWKNWYLENYTLFNYDVRGDQ